MMHLLEKNNAPSSSFAGTIVSSAELRTEEGLEAAELNDGFE